MVRTWDYGVTTVHGELPAVTVPKAAAVTVPELVAVRPLPACCSMASRRAAAWPGMW